MCEVRDTHYRADNFHPTPVQRKEQLTDQILSKQLQQYQ